MPPASLPRCCYHWILAPPLPPSALRLYATFTRRLDTHCTCRRQIGLLLPAAVLDTLDSPVRSALPVHFLEQLLLYATACTAPPPPAGFSRTRWFVFCRSCAAAGLTRSACAAYRRRAPPGFILRLRCRPLAVDSRSRRAPRLLPAKACERYHHATTALTPPPAVYLPVPHTAACTCYTTV